MKKCNVTFFLESLFSCFRRQIVSICSLLFYQILNKGFVQFNLAKMAIKFASSPEVVDFLQRFKHWNGQSDALLNCLRHFFILISQVLIPFYDTCSKNLGCFTEEKNLLTLWNCLALWSRCPKMWLVKFILARRCSSNRRNCWSGDPFLFQRSAHGWVVKII